MSFELKLALYGEMEKDLCTNLFQPFLAEGALTTETGSLFQCLTVPSSKRLTLFSYDGWHLLSRSHWRKKKNIQRECNHQIRPNASPPESDDIYHEVW